MVHNHGWDLAVDDLLLAVEVEHVDGRHLGRRAAGPRRAPRVGLVDQVGVRVLLQVQELTLAGAVVGPVALGCDDPVPAELLEVDGEWVATAAGLCRLFVAVEARVPTRPLGVVKDLHLYEWLLGEDEIERLENPPRHRWNLTEPAGNCVTSPSSPGSAKVTARSSPLES